MFRRGLAAAAASRARVRAILRRVLDTRAFGTSSLESRNSRLQYLETCKNFATSRSPNAAAMNARFSNADKADIECLGEHLKDAYRARVLADKDFKANHEKLVPLVESRD